MAKEILLTQGKSVTVDDEDYDRLNKYKWTCHLADGKWVIVRNCYINGKEKKIQMNREICSINNSDRIKNISNNQFDLRKENLKVIINSNRLGEDERTFLLKQRNRDRYLKNCEEVKRKAREYRKINKEIIKIKDRERRIKNIEVVKLRNNLYRIKNKEKISYCKKNIVLKNKFGLSIEKYNDMFDSQNGLCAICGNPETIHRNGNIIRLAVDHDHSTGKIRELLCGKCNKWLGVCENMKSIIKEYLDTYDK